MEDSLARAEGTRAEPAINDVGANGRDGPRLAIRREELGTEKLRSVSGRKRDTENLKPRGALFHRRIGRMKVRVKVKVRPWVRVRNVRGWA